jgi:parallel beta helix pectate lyase-like protein
MRTTALRILTASFLLPLWSSLAYSQSTRTWVSGLGNDSNPCTRISPCQTFAGALPKTAAGGEISALDPGGFGPVTITKSITLNGEASLATIVAPGTNAIVVNAGPTDVVVIRNLQIQGGTTGQIGIQFLAGGALHVENCTISGFSASPGPSSGIDFEPTTGGTSQLLIKDTVVRENGSGTGGGIFIAPSADTNARVSLSNVRSERNVFGLKALDRSTVFVRDSVFAMNAFSGATAFSAAGGTNLFLDHVSSVGNGTGVISSGGPLAMVRITNVSISGNQTGLLPASGGQIISFGSNNNAGNVTDGAPTSTVPQQ